MEPQLLCKYIYLNMIDNDKINFMKNYRDISGIIKVSIVGTILIRESISLSYLHI